MMEYLHSKYLPEFEEVLTRRALQFEKLAEKDIFQMPEGEQSKHQALLNKLANELLVMDRMRWICKEYIQLEAQLQVQASAKFMWARDQFELLAREAVFWKEQYLINLQHEQFYIQLIQQLTTQLKHHTSPHEHTTKRNP